MAADEEALTVSDVRSRASGLVRSRRRWRAQVLAITVAAALVAATVVATRFAGVGEPAAARTAGPPATAEILRTTLRQTETLDGQLGYGATEALSARAAFGLDQGGGNDEAKSSGTASTGSESAGSSTGVGTFTWLPKAGAVIARGQPVYLVDQRPVALLYGTVPLYRALTVGRSGDDVTELEANLRALGYAGITVDTTYTSSTAAAVSRWQRDRGWPQTGVVDADQVVFAASAVRVAELKASLGTTTVGAVLTYTGIERVVTMVVPLARRQLVQTGTTVTVLLPDGRPVAGTVAVVDATTVTGGDTDTLTGGRGQDTVRAAVRVSDQAGLAGLESAPVGVQLVVGTAVDVLAVPVSALVALAEGGYGIEVVSPAGSQYLAVKPGMYANGLVEISGDGIAAGMRVGVPAE